MKGAPAEILLIEDDALQARFVRALLEFGPVMQVNLHHADRMSAALARLLSHRPDVVLMDLDLPDSNGLDSLGRIRAAAPLLPVIVLSAREDDATRRQAVEMGAEDYLFKGRVDRHSIERAVSLAVRRKRAEDEVRQARQGFAELSASLDEVFWIAGPDLLGRTFVSAAYEAIWGRSCASVQARPESWLEAVHPEDRARVQQALQTVVAGGDHRIEYRILQPDGGVRWIQERGMPMADATGRVNRLIGFARECSREKQTEQSLEQSEEHFRAVFLKSPVPTVVTSLSEGRFLRVNESFSALTGYTCAELLGHTSLELGLWAEPAMRDHLASELLHCGFLKSREGRLITKTGATRHLLVSASKVQIGLSNCGIVMAEDITDRKVVEEQLRAQASLLDLAQDAIIVRDLADHVLYWNRGAENLYGWTAEQARGRKTAGLYHVETPLHGADCEQLLKTGQWFGQIHQRTKSGQLLTVNSRRNLVRDEQGRPKSVLVINTDVTQHKKLEDQFFRAQRLESIGQLAGGIAHDFNNLLTIISGHCELLGADLPRENPMRDSVAHIGRAAQHAATLTRQLLAFSRQQILELKVANLNTLVAGVEKMLRRIIEENIQLETRLAPGLPSVKVDASQIEQVILNLVINARDAMSGGGRLLLETGNVPPPEEAVFAPGEVRAESWVRLSISDTGTGMPPEVLARIFEPFFTTKEIGKGTGLGLAVVQGIIKQSGGHITLDSQPGAGTTFHIYLPAGPAARGRKTETRLIEPPHGEETILLVEDEEGMRSIVTLVLERHGYTVIAAASGREAQEILRTRGPEIALVLTDLIMPEMNGCELAESLLKEKPELKILLMSGYSDAAAAGGRPSAEAWAFLPKPFTPGSLACKVRAVLDQGRAPVEEFDLAGGATNQG